MINTCSSNLTHSNDKSGQFRRKVDCESKIRAQMKIRHAG